MSNLEFESDEEYAPRYESDEPKGFTGLVLRWGIAGDQKTAGYVLLGVAIAAVLLAFILPMVFGSGGRAPAPQAQVDSVMLRPRS